jgi:hypothetical protein
MTHQTLIVVFIIAFLLLFAAFGMQRATLLLSREASIPYQHAAALLPRWYATVVWLLRFVKWSLLLYIAISWSWWIALAIFFGDFLLSTVLPIPYSFYAPIFRKRIAQIKREDMDVGEYLEQVFQSSRMYGA